jgi:hypothetical protein
MLSMSVCILLLTVMICLAMSQKEDLLLAKAGHRGPRKADKKI